uniref:Uncharacterized protein n=1 Tax=Timema poppense TaxID=170557 RepID=A0A7R9HJT1_TIMPO|nr:unnamed protein product [Timema poppensis]
MSYGLVLVGVCLVWSAPSSNLESLGRSPCHGDAEDPDLSPSVQMTHTVALWRRDTALQPEIAESSRQREPEIAESSSQREPEIAESSRQQGPEIAESSRQREPEIAESSRQREPEIAESSLQQEPEIAEHSRTKRCSYRRRKILLAPEGTHRTTEVY